MICAYLLHRDRCKDADEVLTYYGRARTFNAKVGSAADVPINVSHSIYHIVVCISRDMNYRQFPFIVALRILSRTLVFLISSDYRAIRHVNCKVSRVIKILCACFCKFCAPFSQILHIVSSRYFHFKIICGIAVCHASLLA